MREERVALEDRVDVALVRRQPDDVLVAEEGCGPSVGSSKPPIIRSVVVLPHPDGPSSAKNEPRGISTEIPSTATDSSNRLTSGLAVAQPVAAAASTGCRGRSALGRTPVCSRLHSASFTTTCLIRVYSSIE